MTVLFSTVEVSLKSERGHENVYPATLFLLAFMAAFVITISGVPLVIAKAIYRGKTVIGIIGGLLVTFYGLKVTYEAGLMRTLQFRPLSSLQTRAMVEAPVLGFTAGLLLFHHLDPFYDSVFFLTGRPGAASHHPITVTSFGLGLGAIYLALAYSFDLLIVSREATRIATRVKLVFGFLTLILGFSFATGTFSSVVEVIKWTDSLVSGS